MTPQRATTPRVTEIATTSVTSLTASTALPLDRQPAAVYLAGLAQSLRRTMRDALNTIADTLQGGADALMLDSSALRFQYTAAIR